MLGYLSFDVHAGVFAEGGGVFSEGPLILRETVVTDNVARASGGTTLTAAFGGGVAGLSGVTVEGSSISGNLAEARGDGSVATARRSISASVA